MSNKNKLYYVYDPMCSWCWGYKPVWQHIEEVISDELDIVYLLGGLAADTNEPMSLIMQQQIASYWKKIESYLGTKFNYDFWSLNTPRRATYPSCRAIISARTQSAEKEMLAAIQHGYYLEAKNPSENDVLIGFAKEIGLDDEKFTRELYSEQTQLKLLEEIHFARSIGGNSFPSLFVENDRGVTEIPIDYQSAELTLHKIRKV